ncbi:CatB-related O-acetyltransferase [Methylobacterium oryzisoli]|uniref:CatB-related O-acetyltransferase n=1 Tax=Methylobacterium oryzisoli TaxID=3385502 RepID=UPI003892A355
MALPNRLFDRFVVPLLRGREFDSTYLREEFRSRYGIEIGLYSYGCFDRWRVPPGTRIGRYCSFAKSVRILNANHPVDALSTHPFLYDPAFGVVRESRVSATRVEIEDDVWLGHNATVAPGVARIGRGAIIGTGAVVTRDVPPYAIVAGVPGRVIRSRFPPAAVGRIEASRWWTLDREALRDLVAREPDLLHLTAPVTEAALA